jgi:hypothetical protein
MSAVLNSLNSIINRNKYLPCRLLKQINWAQKIWERCLNWAPQNYLTLNLVRCITWLFICSECASIRGVVTSRVPKGSSRGLPGRATPNWEIYLSGRRAPDRFSFRYVTWVPTVNFRTCSCNFDNLLGLVITWVTLRIRRTMDIWNVCNLQNYASFFHRFFSHERAAILLSTEF